MSSSYLNLDKPIPAVNISQNDPLNESTSKQVVFYLDSFFSITSINSLEDLANLPKELILDYRLTFKDTNEDRSCLKGIDLDPEYNRSQLFVIKKDAQIIGICTLFYVPYKQLPKKTYITLEKSRLISKSILELLKFDNPDTFVIEVGWFQLLTEYQNQNLGTKIVFQFLIPKIKKLIAKTSTDFFLLCSASGLIDHKVRKIMAEQLKTLTTEGVEIPKEELSKLGKINPKAVFTSITATKIGLMLWDNVFNQSLGPVYMRRFLSKKEFYTNILPTIF